MRVLFVDDEEKVLRGIRRMLRGHVDWRMHFLQEGRAALHFLEKHDVDIVVADMRMPGMDGVQLLNAVQKTHPGVVRIVLSGYSDQETVLHTVRPAHQFLSKPCERDTLVSALERVHSLQSVFTNKRLRNVMTRIDSLPVLPSVLQKLEAELEGDDPSVDRAGRILAMDAALSAGVLKMINSAFFGLPTEVTTPEQAVALLGLDVLKGLVFSECFFNMYENQAPNSRLSMERLREHNLRVAGFARVVCGSMGGGQERRSQAFLCGLLHDLGKLILANSLPEEYAKALEYARANNVSIREAELEVFGSDHADLGGYLLGLWGFSEEVVRAVACHHMPGGCVAEPMRSVTVTHVANYVDHLLVVLNEQYAEHPLDAQYVIQAGALEQLPVWIESCHGMLGEGVA